MNARHPLGPVLVAATIVLLSLPKIRAAAPNVLVVIADDCTFNELPTYGGKNAKTPNIDALAKQSMVFNRAYVAEAICQPCRAELYTGLYPMGNGCNWNHSSSAPGTESISQHFGRLGYRVGIAGKVHVRPKSVYAFESVDGFDHSAGRSPTNPHDLGPARDFITRSDDPFVLVVGLTEPHVPWVMGDPSQYPESELVLPPNLADTEMMRNAYSKYLAEITYMDGQVGELVNLIDQTDHREDTIVVFTSEQGAQFPGFKWTNYDVGLHTAMMFRWPGRIAAGQRTDALIQYADVLPTLLDAAGHAPDAHQFDGSSFLPVLLGESQSHREFAYATHNNIPEGPPYPIRSVTDGRYRYIRNLRPDNLFIEKHLMGYLGSDLVSRNYWRSWIWESGTNQHTYDLVHRYQNRPAEELYDLASDPLELTNLIGKPGLKRVHQELSDELDDWLASQNDPGIQLDTVDAHQAAKKGNHQFLGDQRRP